ncbi:MAG: aminopeptidase P family N-terminal domain-containing protein, partial [Planctomycetales bacterium]|nr:aminopeptidase P family N-terminal domain-containing protein [Planctomycetales bacterium]
MSLLDIDVPACRIRQQRLLEYLRAAQIDMAVISSIEHIQYLVGPRFAWTFQPLAAIRADDGHVTLVAPERRLPEVHAADDVVPYEAQWLSTLRNDQR